MISVKRNTWRALSLVIGDCRKKGNFEFCQGKEQICHSHTSLCFLRKNNLIYCALSSFAWNHLLIVPRAFELFGMYLCRTSNLDCYAWRICAEKIMSYSRFPQSVRSLIERLDLTHSITSIVLMRTSVPFQVHFVVIDVQLKGCVHTYVPLFVHATNCNKSSYYSRTSLSSGYQISRKITL